MPCQTTNPLSARESRHGVTGVAGMGSGTAAPSVTEMARSSGLPPTTAGSIHGSSARKSSQTTKGYDHHGIKFSASGLQTIPEYTKGPHMSPTQQSFRKSLAPTASRGTNSSASGLQTLSEYTKGPQMATHQSSRHSLAPTDSLSTRHSSRSSTRGDYLNALVPWDASTRDLRQYPIATDSYSTRQPSRSSAMTPRGSTTHGSSQSTLRGPSQLQPYTGGYEQSGPVARGPSHGHGSALGTSGSSGTLRGYSYSYSYSVKYEEYDYEHWSGSG